MPRKTSDHGEHSFSIAESHRRERWLSASSDLLDRPKLPAPYPACHDRKRPEAPRLLRLPLGSGPAGRRTDPRRRAGGSCRRDRDRSRRVWDQALLGGRRGQGARPYPQSCLRRHPSCRVQRKWTTGLNLPWHTHSIHFIIRIIDPVTFQPDTQNSNIAKDPASHSNQMLNWGPTGRVAAPRCCARPSARRAAALPGGAPAAARRGPARWAGPPAPPHAVCEGLMPVLLAGR